MERARVSGELPGGRHFDAQVSQRVILVDVDGRACMAHDRWFDQVQAAEMIRQLEVFVSGADVP